MKSEFLINLIKKRSRRALSEAYRAYDEISRFSTAPMNMTNAMHRTMHTTESMTRRGPERPRCITGDASIIAIAARVTPTHSVMIAAIIILIS